MTLSGVKAGTSATEFLRWVKYLDDDVNAFHREDWFWARIAYEVYLCKFMLGGKPDVPFKEFLIKFEADKTTAPAAPTEEELKERAGRLKTVILAWLNLDPDGGKKGGAVVNPGRPGAGKRVKNLPSQGLPRPVGRNKSKLNSQTRNRAR